MGDGRWKDLKEFKLAETKGECLREVAREWDWGLGEAWRRGVVVVEVVDGKLVVRATEEVRLFVV